MHTDAETTFVRVYGARNAILGAVALVFAGAAWDGRSPALRARDRACRCSTRSSSSRGSGSATSSCGTRSSSRSSRPSAYRCGGRRRCAPRPGRVATGLFVGDKRRHGQSRGAPGAGQGLDDQAHPLRAEVGEGLHGADLVRRGRRPGVDRQPRHQPRLGAERARDRQGRARLRRGADPGALLLGRSRRGQRALSAGGAREVLVALADPEPVRPRRALRVQGRAV